MSSNVLDWTNRTNEDADHVDEQIHLLMNSFGLQLTLEAILHRVNISIRWAQERDDEDDYLYQLKADLERTLENYKNR